MTSPDNRAYTWSPTSDYLETARVARFAHAHGIDGITELRRRSVADVAWYWDAVVRDLDLVFSTPYEQVLDLAAGIEHPEWFVAGRLNIVDSCLTRWARDPEAGRDPAVVHESEDGAVRRLTFAELDEAVGRIASGLLALGVRRGDAVALYLPMVPEAVVAFYAVARIGAVAVPLFSGFAASAIAARLQDAGAVAVVTADATVRRGRTVPLRSVVDEAVVSCPSVRHVLEVDNLGTGDRSWERLLATSPASEGLPPATALETHEPLLLAYTSGTTSKPKGAVHTHAGFLVKTASEVAYSFDLGRGGVFTWVTDMGWIMGPLSIVGTHANGGTLLLYEGSPDRPDLDRLWQLVERHRVSLLGVSPTLVRTLQRDGHGAVCHDLSSVHTIGSTGEPWDPESYAWLARDVLGGRVPVINFSGGTEVGGSFLAPYPVEEIRSCSLGGPSLGMDVDVVDSDGHSVRGVTGELVCRQPWPSMTRGVWGDPQRYLDAYWTTYPGMWHHGDFALVEDRQWFIQGRSDDVINVAGKRLAPAEVEDVLLGHPGVAEAAVVGLPDASKGEAVVAFWVPTTDARGDEERVSTELRALVSDRLGKPFAPSAVHVVAALPRTRTTKVMRRAIRAAALDRDPGDLSGAENPDVVAQIREQLHPA
jgi:acetyl-CoA synthetase